MYRETGTTWIWRLMAILLGLFLVVCPLLVPMHATAEERLMGETRQAAVPVSLLSDQTETDPADAEGNVGLPAPSDEGQVTPEPQEPAEAVEERWPAGFTVGVILMAVLGFVSALVFVNPNLRRPFP